LRPFDDPHLTGGVDLERTRLQRGLACPQLAARQGTVGRTRGLARGPLGLAAAAALADRALLLLAHAAPPRAPVSGARPPTVKVEGSRYRPCLPMYCTTPSGTRYQPGLSATTRARQSVEEIAMAGISSSEYSPGGSSAVSMSWPGRVTPTKWASCHSSSASFHCRIWLSASAPVMKKSSASGCCRRRSRSVSIV